MKRTPPCWSLATPPKLYAFPRSLALERMTVRMYSDRSYSIDTVHCCLDKIKNQIVYIHDTTPQKTLKKNLDKIKPLKTFLHLKNISNRIEETKIIFNNTVKFTLSL